LFDDVSVDDHSINVTHPSVQHNCGYRICGTSHIDIRLTQQYYIGLLSWAKGPNSAIEPYTLS